MIVINKANSTLLKFLGTTFRLHTDMDLKIGDIVGIPFDDGFSEEEIIMIEDSTSDADRHHGDIKNKHMYTMTTKSIK